MLEREAARLLDLPAKLVTLNVVRTVARTAMFALPQPRSRHGLAAHSPLSDDSSSPECRQCHNGPNRAAAVSSRAHHRHTLLTTNIARTVA